MSTPHLPGTGSAKRLHPLLAIAAVALVIASLTAVAAITGVLPIASSANGPAAQNPTGQVTDSAAPAPITTAAAPQTTPAAGTESAPIAQAGNPAPAAQNNPTPPPAEAPAYANAAPSAPCHGCGTVESIREIQHEGQGTGLGAIGGALAGGLVGNQFGAGGGRAAMTVLGAVGGGFAGNTVEKHLRSNLEYQVKIRTDDGHIRYFNYKNPPPYQQGQRVKVGKSGIQGSL